MGVTPGWPEKGCPGADFEEEERLSKSAGGFLSQGGAELVETPQNSRKFRSEFPTNLTGRGLDS